MTELFSNLALRNEGSPSPAILQPRVPSLFEASNNSGGLAEFQTKQEKSDSYPVSPEPMPGRSVLQPEERSLGEPKAESSQASRIVSNIQSVEKPTLGMVMNPVKTSSDKSADRGGQDLASSPRRVRPIDSKDGQSLSEMETLRVETIMSREERASGRSLPMKNDQLARERTSDRILYPNVKSVSHRPEEPPDADPQDQMIKSGRNLPNNLIHPREQASESEPPVVQIHIGRIEVRAVTAPPAQSAVKTAPAQPRMTLDDYLRQREGHR
jgi:hypothetical protein